MSGRRLARGLGLVSLFAVFVYGALLVVADGRDVADALARLEVRTVLTILALSLVNLGLRSVRLRYLVGVAGGQISLNDAAYVQFAGTTMTITPGKVGEILKAYLARETAGFPMARGVALLFIERIADLLAVLALAAGGLSLIGAGPWALAAVVAVVLAGVVLISRPSLHRSLLGLLERRTRARPYIEHAGSLLDAFDQTLRPAPLAVSVSLSIVAWGAEGVGFHLALRGLGFDVLDPASAVALYAVATVVGALAFFPGGIGLTEGSMMGILVATGATSDVAFSATMVIRFATLWFGVGLGWAVFASRPRLMRGFLSGSSDPGPGPTGNVYDKYGTRNPLSRFLVGRFRSAVDELLDSTGAREILDVGCGEGVLAATWARADETRRVVGIDLPDDELTRCWGRIDCPNASFVSGDAARLPFDDASFDLVTGVEVLEHVQDPVAVLAEMRRVSRGSVLVSVPREPLWRILNLARGAYVSDLGNTPGHIQHWSRRSFERLVGTDATIVERRAPLPWTVVLLETRTR